MIPDYVLQAQEIQRNLESQSIVTMENWQDSVAHRFNDAFIKPYEDRIYLYINGGMDITGMGLDGLLSFIDRKQSEMEQLSGMSINVNPSSGSEGRVHNEWRVRDPWYEPFNGTQPGNLDAREVKGVMNSRNSK